MTREEAIKFLKEQIDLYDWQAEDINPIVDPKRYDEYQNTINSFKMAIISLEQEPCEKTGHWIRVDKDKLRCSECEVIHFIAQYPQSAKINFCPNCGRAMKGERK